VEFMQGQETEQIQPIPVRTVAVKMTDVGRTRDHNEDCVAATIPNGETLATKGALYLVADGMGGHQAGEVASQRAAEAVVQEYYADPNTGIAASLAHALRRANTAVYQMAQFDLQRAGMGTTTVAAVVRGPEVHIANVGDSRAYLLRDGELIQITKDHSFVQEQIDANIITPEEARTHPKRNVITRALGHKPDVQVDTFKGQLVAGDILLLCSDGLSGTVTDDDIRGVLGRLPPYEAIIELIDQANRYGGPDNVSAVLVQALPLDPAYPPALEVAPGTEPEPAPIPRQPSATPKRSSSGRGWRLALGLALLLLLAGLAAVGLSRTGDGEDAEPALTAEVTASPSATSTPDAVPSSTPTGESVESTATPTLETAQPETPIAPTSTSIASEPEATPPIPDQTQPSGESP
jgi:serine/threonine protein phosphatase PrpC